jgi:hypothetical protein
MQKTSSRLILSRDSALDYMSQSADNFVREQSNGTIYFINDIGKLSIYHKRNTDGSIYATVIPLPAFTEGLYESCKAPKAIDEVFKTFKNDDPYIYVGDDLNPPPIPTVEKVCDCGLEKSGASGRHSNYCQKYVKLEIV